MVEERDNSESLSSRILLSICIPTYNRASFLKEILDQLLPQVKAYKELVEICISDNCSTDNTRDVVYESAEDHCIPISYNKNEQNIGGNKNMAEVISMSRGKYIYILGDDDVLSPDFLTVVLRLIYNTDNFGIILFNRLCGDENCSYCNLKDSMYENCQKQFPVTSFIYYFLDQPNFISSVVFNRKCWELGAFHLKDEDYFGYNWFARIYWGAIELGDNCLYYYMPLVIQRNGSKTWIKFWPQYYISSLSNIFFDLDSIIPGIYAKWANILRLSVKRVLPVVAIYKKYYRKQEIRNALSKHLTKMEMALLYFYLYFPFSAKLFKIVTFLKVL